MGECSWQELESLKPIVMSKMQSKLIREGIVEEKSKKSAKRVQKLK